MNWLADLAAGFNNENDPYELNRIETGTRRDALQILADGSWSGKMTATGTSRQIVE